LQGREQRFSRTTNFHRERMFLSDGDPGFRWSGDVPRVLSPLLYPTYGPLKSPPDTGFLTCSSFADASFLFCCS